MGARRSEKLVIKSN